MNLFGVKTTTLIANAEVYTTMRENATFLLELCSSSSSSSSSASSSSGGSLPASSMPGQKRSPQQMPMPVVIEHHHHQQQQHVVGMPDLNLSSKPSTSRADSARSSRVCRLSGKFTPFRKSFVGVPPSTPDNVWLAPDSFACLECLGTAAHEDLPYEMFGLGATANENGYDRVSNVCFLSLSLSTPLFPSLSLCVAWVLIYNIYIFLNNINSRVDVVIII